MNPGPPQFPPPLLLAQPPEGMETAVRRLMERPAALHLLCGHSGAYTASLLVGSATRRPFAVVDGAMRFNSYTMAGIARLLAIPPKALLRHIHVTRSFTAFQTEAAITTKLPHFLARTPSCRSAIILGLLDTYYDEQVSLHECRASLGRVLGGLRELVRNGLHVLVADLEVSRAPAGKQMLFPLLHDAADRVTLLEYRHDGMHLNEQQRRTRIWDATTTPLPSSLTETRKPGENSGGR